MKIKGVWRPLSSILDNLESELISERNKCFWTQVLSWLNLSACWLQEQWEMVSAQGPWEFTPTPAVGKKLPVQRPPCPWQVELRCSPSHWERGTFSLHPLVDNPQRAPGAFHKPHSWSPHPGEPQVLTEYLSCACSPTAMGGWGGGARGGCSSILTFMETILIALLDSRLWRAPNPQKIVENTLARLAEND